MSDRAFFAKEEVGPYPSYAELCATWTTNRGHLCIEINQEKAVDSYNEDITCSIELTPQQVEALIKFLQEGPP